MKRNGKITDVVRRFAQPLAGERDDYDSLMNLVGDRRFVLLGEASHGTHEFYRARAEITKRLIVERGFTAVAVEADFPDALRVDAFVRGRGDGEARTISDAAATAALNSFTRFPQWMWRNRDVRGFVADLRAHNEGLAEENKVSFYGIDLYSLHASIEAVLEYLGRVDPEAAERARARYSCFEHFDDSQAYGYAASRGHIEPCEEEVVKQLVELHTRARDYASRDGLLAMEEFFHAEQNARVVRNAEEYYRSMFRGGRISSWNLRDRHMCDTLDALVQFADYQGRKAKLVVWAHNSHLGDARATEMGWKHGEWNVGQLVRETYGDEALLVGFSTYAGTVTAASNWGDEPEQKRVRPALAGSYEELFHETGTNRFILFPHGTQEIADALREPRLQRAIGVIYRPETERMSHYFQARLSEQFDAVIHFDETRAVEPLMSPRDTKEQTKLEDDEAPETYPSGM